MKCQILFSRNNMPLSRYICEITREPVSHAAAYFPDLDIVLHATFPKVNVKSLSKFRDASEIVLTSDQLDIDTASLGRVLLLIGKWYDLPGLIYLGIAIGLRKIGINIPRANIWERSGAYMCTELVSKLLFGEVNSEITPFGLYCRLLERGNVNG